MSKPKITIERYWQWCSLRSKIGVKGRGLELVTVSKHLAVSERDVWGPAEINWCAVGSTSQATVLLMIRVLRTALAEAARMDRKHPPGTERMYDPKGTVTFRDASGKVTRVTPKEPANG